ncbi:MAG TPA: methyltransferase domain-containing protein [Bryobacteraceae bacterium]|nr:methyltransferase domain-containing protein [Bryobacteraceae bacterium]
MPKNSGPQGRSFPWPPAPGPRLLFLFALLPILPTAFAQDAKLAPYYPTPETIVEKMLQLGGLKAGEKMFDLGSGDGRIVMMAAQKFHADAVGVELDKDLCRQSLDRIRKLGLEKTARIINGDLLEQNYSSADLVTVYLLPDSINNKVQPLLDKQLRKGARVVAHDFEFRNWAPEKVENIPDDGEGRSHALFLYRK